MATARAPKQDWGRVGALVRQRRSALGFRKQEDAAAKAGVGVQTWREIEGGKKDGYTVPILVAVSMALDWPPDMLQRLATGEEPPPDDDRLTVIEGRLDRMEGKLDYLIEALGVPASTDGQGPS